MDFDGWTGSDAQWGGGAPCPALMVVGRTALTMELYGDNVIGEYARRYNVNVRGRMSSSNVHLVVRHRL